MTSRSRNVTGRRIAAGVAAATTLSLAVGVGFVLGRSGAEGDGPGGGPGDVGVDPGDVRLANSSLTRPTSCDDLLDHYIERGLDLVTAYGWDWGPIMFDGPMEESAGATDRAWSAAPRTSRSTSSETGTNVQETGVDEPDAVKTVGSLLIRMLDDSLVVYDIAGDEPTVLGSLALPELRGGELLVSGERVWVVDGSDDTGLSGSRIAEVDISDPGAPQLARTLEYSSTIAAARLHDDVVRVVLETDLPVLDFESPDEFSPRGVDEKTALEHNRELVRATTLADWLPSTDGEQAVACEDVAMTSTDTDLGTTTVVTLTEGEPTTTAGATAASTFYFSAERFYLATPAATSAWWRDVTGDCFELCRQTSDGETYLFAFALDGDQTTYVASGSVEGAIRDRWSMDYADDSLRVALGATAQTGNFNSVVTLREEGSSLVESGRVDRLGVNEQIKSVRWFDDLAIVVTFRQTDPLYAIDLTDPAAPRLLGELKIPGFSEYLHPLGEDRLLGLGQDADANGMSRGAQASIFDVTDLTAPQRLDVVRYPRFSQALAGLDPRQFTWLPEQRTALTVVSQGWEGRTGWVSVLTLDGGAMENRMVEVEHGSDVDQVRLVPTADERVVLVTADDVSFFEV